MSVGRPLLHGDVLPDEAGDFVGLLRLQPSDTLLHQITALHVEVKHTLFGLDLSSGDHLGVGVMVQCLLKDARRLNYTYMEMDAVTSRKDERLSRKGATYMRDQIYEVHSMSIESKNMIGALFLPLGHPLYCEEARAEKWPLRQYF